MTSSEAQTYSLQEGAFYGQLFVPDDQDILTYACEGRAQAAGEPETGPLHDRDCTEPAGDGLTQCGMTFTGTCADFTATPSRHGDDDDEGGAPHACENQSFSGFYNDCHTQASDADGQFPRHSEYDEVITVYVSP